MSLQKNSKTATVKDWVIRIASVHLFVYVAFLFYSVLKLDFVRVMTEIVSRLWTLSGVWERFVGVDQGRGIFCTHQSTAPNPEGPPAERTLIAPIALKACPLQSWTDASCYMRPDS